MIVYIKLLLTALLWGGTFIAGRVVAEDVGPFSAAFFRFFIASIFLVLFTYRIEGKLPMPGKRQMIPVFLLGMTGVFSYNVFFFKGLKLINAGRAAIIIAGNPILITLLSAYFFKEKLNMVKGAGIIISVIGAVIVISKGSLSEIVNGLIGKAVMNALSPLASVTYSSVIGTVLLFFPAFFEGMFKDYSSYTNMAWLSIFYLGFFGTVIGFVWYYEGIKKIGAMRASLFINFVPICAVVQAFFILDEPITLSLLIGTVLVCSGVYLTNKRFTPDQVKSTV
ncbi:MAG: EamA family transporter [Deltaproteobacteria bacterium]|nr:EamA family transporter [Deltaproteobacteria bacterium]